MTNNENREENRQDVWSVLKSGFKAASPILVVMLASFFGGSEYRVWTDPEYRALREEMKELKSQLETKNEELTSLKNIRMTEILGSSKPEDVYEWGKTLPDSIISAIKKYENREDVKNILSVTIENENNTPTMEVKFKHGASTSAKDVNEYDFICNSKVENVTECKNWSLTEIETSASLGGISETPARDAIELNCQNEWQIIKVERSRRFDVGENLNEDLFEVVCLFKQKSEKTGNVRWISREIDVKKNGEITIKSGTD